MLTQDQMALIARAKGWKSTSVQSKAATPYVEIIEDLEKQLNDREVALAAEQSESATKIAELEAQLAKKEAENTMITAQRDGLLTENTRKDFALSSQVQTKAAADAQPNDEAGTVAQENELPRELTEIIREAIDTVTENRNEEKRVALEAVKQHGYGSLEGWYCEITDEKTGYKWTYRLARRHAEMIKPLWIRRRWDKVEKKTITESLSKAHGYTTENPPPEVMEYIENGGRGLRSKGY